MATQTETSDRYTIIAESDAQIRERMEVARFYAEMGYGELEALERADARLAFRDAALAKRQAAADTETA